MRTFEELLNSPGVLLRRRDVGLEKARALELTDMTDGEKYFFVHELLRRYEALIQEKAENGRRTLAPDVLNDEEKLIVILARAALEVAENEDALIEAQRILQI